MAEWRVQARRGGPLWRAMRRKARFVPTPQAPEGPRRSAGPFLLTFLLLVAGAPVGASAGAPAKPSGMPAAPARGPFSEVPRDHWAFRSIRELALRGFFTGYPAVVFDGKRRFARYDLAVATQRIAADLWGGPFGAQRLPLAGAETGERVQQLAREFQPELELLGPPLPARPGDAGGVTASTRPPVAESRLRSRAVGAALARAEWERGTPVLRLSRGWGAVGSLLDPVIGLPCEPLGCIRDQQTEDEAFGHDAEIYRLIGLHGPPPSSRHQWITLVADPAAAWATFGNPLVLDPTHPAGDFREGGDLRLGSDRAVVAHYGTRAFTLSLPELANPYRVEAARGPAAAELLFVRFRTEREDKAGTAYECVDLRSGQVLSYSLSRDAAVNAPGRGG